MHRLAHTRFLEDVLDYARDWADLSAWILLDQTECSEGALRSQESLGFLCSTQKHRAEVPQWLTAAEWGQLNKNDWDDDMLLFVIIQVR